MTKEAYTQFTDLRVLIFGNDGEFLARISRDIMIGLDADVTIVDDAEEARALTASDAYDAVLAVRPPDSSFEAPIDGTDGDHTFATPLILIGASTESSDILTAVRGGVFDVLPGPVDVGMMLEAIQRAARVARQRSRLITRNQRLRRVSSRLVRERRDLRRRVDLICKDLVTAYQRLAERVVSTQDNVN